MSMTYQRKYNFTPRYVRKLPFKRVPIRGTYFISTGGPPSTGPYVKISRTIRAFLAQMRNPRNPYRTLVTGRVLYYLGVGSGEAANTVCYSAGQQTPAYMNTYAMAQNQPCVAVDHPFDE